MFTPLCNEQDITSPEGVEERVKNSAHFYTTMTGGGKYRVYFNSGDAKVPPHTIGVFDTLEEATKSLAMTMGMFASIKIDPKGTIEMLLSGREK